MQSTPELADRLLLACSVLTRSATAAAPGTTLSLTQARTLGTLHRQGPTRVSRLAELERCSQPSMTGLVTRCADAGLVERTDDPDDARAVLVRLTPAGERALATDRERLSRPVAQALTDLPAQLRTDLEQALDVVERVSAALTTTGA